MSPRAVLRRAASAVDPVVVLAVGAIAAIGVLTQRLIPLRAGSVLVAPYVRQSRWLLLGAALAVVAARIDLRAVRRYAYHAYALSLAGLAAVYVLATPLRHAHRWLVLERLVLQPAEFAKLALVLALARHFADTVTTTPWTYRQVRVPLVLTAVPATLIWLQPSASTSVLCLLLLVSALALASIQRSTLVGLAASAAVLGCAVWARGLREYNYEKLRAFLEPQRYARLSGYQAHRALDALASGGVTGSRELHTARAVSAGVPEAATDMPLAIWGHFAGFLGVFALLGLYLIVVVRGLRIAAHARDRFGLALAAGVSASLFWHVALNVGMTLRLLPTMGTPLPLCSYGGSGIAVTMVGVGLLLNVARTSRAVT